MGSRVPSLPSRAIRMLETETGLPTPRRSTWFSAATAPQLGRCSKTEGAANASPVAARSHNLAATFTQCPT